MKKLLSLLMLISITANAATHYIHSGATGSGDGSTWNNAFTTLTNISWVGGDTYYIAAGSYTGSVSIPSLSGTNWTRLIKANTASNSSDAGWSASFTNAATVQVASFSISSSYFEINGVTGTGTNGFGITITCPVKPNNGNAVFEVSPGVSYIKLSHVEISGPGWGYNYDVSGFKANNTSSYPTQKGYYIGDCYVHDVSQNGLVFSSISGSSFSDYGLIYERNTLWNCGYSTSAAGGHGQGIQIGSGAALSTNCWFIIRNSTFRNILGTANIAALGYSRNTNILVYNNIFANDNQSFNKSNATWTTYDANYIPSSPGVIFSSDVYGISDNFNVYNNTFYHVNKASVMFYGSSNNACVVANNLWIDSHFNYKQMGVSAYNNEYYNCQAVTAGDYGVPHGETNQVSDTVYPVQDATNFVFSLKAGVNSVGGGTNLYSLFTNDYAGNSRTSSGAWDIGAYAYLGNPTVTITSPTNGSLTANGTVSFAATVTAGSGTVTNLAWYTNGVSAGSATNLSLAFSGTSTNTVYALAMANDGKSGYSPTNIFIYYPELPQVSFSMQ